MSEDKYFEKKASEVYEAIKSDMNKGIVSEEVIKSYIRTSMKEVARDQRSACVDALIEHCDVYDKTDVCEELYAPIQNATIEEN